MQVRRHLVWVLMYGFLIPVSGLSTHIALDVTHAAAAEKAPLKAVAGSEWQLVTLRNIGAAAGEVWVQFAGNGRLGGFTGCNRMNGAYQQAGGQLTINAPATTRMACKNEMLARQEAAFVQALAQAKTFRATHLQLALYDAGGAELMTLRRRDFD